MFTDLYGYIIKYWVTTLDLVTKQKYVDYSKKNSSELQVKAVMSTCSQMRHIHGKKSSEGFLRAAKEIQKFNK